jgi:transcriptional regulator with XRE-family HTH domain
MPAHDARAIGRRIKHFREEKGISSAELASRAKISRSYLSELENGKGEHKRPSADVMYKIGNALGISMSDLLGRPLITGPRTKPSPSLERFAEENGITQSDVEMLASIRFRGDAPQTQERWAFIYNAIKASRTFDEGRGRRR